jgi:hypothetical protein
LASILANVSQITIYLPEHLARRLRREARRAGKSVSAYVIDAAVGRSAQAAPWPEGFFELQGSCHGGLRPPEDPPPEEPDSA